MPFIFSCVSRGYYIWLREMTYCEEDEHSNNRWQVNHKCSCLAQTLVLVTSAREKALDPRACLCRVILDRFDGGVQEDKDNSEEDDIANDDQDDDDSTPLELHNSADSSVRLTG